MYRNTITSEAARSASAAKLITETGLIASARNASE